MNVYTKLRNNIVSQFPEYRDEIDLMIASVFNNSSILLQGSNSNEFSNIMKVITSSIENIGKPPKSFNSETLVKELSQNLTIESLPKYIIIKNADLQSEKQVSILTEIVKRKCATITTKYYEMNNENMQLLSTIPVQIFDLNNIHIPKQVEITEYHVDMNIKDYTSSIGFTTDALSALEEIVNRTKKFMFIPDSKIKEGTTIMKIVCLLRGESHIDVDDLLLLKYILPDDYDQFTIISSIINSTINKY